MKKLFIALFFMTVGIQSYAQSENNTASSFIMALKHKSFSILDSWISEKADKKSMETKFGILLGNASKSGINIEKLQFDFQTSYPIEGLDRMIMVIVYKFDDNSNWDDLILLIEKKTYSIVDIGLPEKSLMKVAAERGKNYKTPGSLLTVFYPNIPQKEAALDAAKNIIRIVKTGKVDDIIPLMAYTGGNSDPNRKHMGSALNPKNEKDRLQAKSKFEQYEGMFASPESVYIEGGFRIDTNYNTCSFRLVCKETKNSEYFSFVLVKGKYLLY